MFASVESIRIAQSVTTIMDSFCRGCLTKYDEPLDLLQYSERNRRLFVYSTGLQVKRNDTFTFQLCKNCLMNMKIACKFKKQCRSSEKLFRSFTAMKDSGENVDFTRFLKTNESAAYRFSMVQGNSTPAIKRLKDDDNESTCTSIRNFMTDIIKDEDILDTEARIIQQVIEEEADVLEDSLDSHWLRDDASIDADFRLDFSFSPFSTPHYQNNEPYVTPKKNAEDNFYAAKQIVPFNKKVIEEFSPVKIQDLIDIPDEVPCSIDKNLKLALKDEGNKEFSLDDLLASPAAAVASPASSTIREIIYGNKEELLRVKSSNIRPGKCMEKLYKAKENHGILEKNENESENISLPITESNCSLDKIYDKSLICKVCDKFFQNLDALKLHLDVYHNQIHDISSNSENNKAAAVLETVEVIENVQQENLIKHTTEVNFEFKKPHPPIDSYDEREMLCKLCDKTLKTVRGLRLHFHRIHNISIAKPKNSRHKHHKVCMFCGKEFNDYRVYYRHMKAHEKVSGNQVIQKKKSAAVFKCAHCDMECTTKYHLSNHMKKHIASYTRKAIICHICGSKFTFKTNYYTHMRKHEADYKFECAECGKKLFRKADLVTHLRVHTGEKPFPCPYCPKSFRISTQRNVHIKRHLKKKFLRCYFCGWIFETEEALTLHVKKSDACKKERARLVNNIAKTEKERESLLFLRADAPELD